MRSFFTDWLTALNVLPRESLTEVEREELVRLNEEIGSSLTEMDEEVRVDAEAEPPPTSAPSATLSPAHFPDGLRAAAGPTRRGPPPRSPRSPPPARPWG